MNRISDPLELLTSQHEAIDELLALAASAPDPAVRDLALDELTEHLGAHLAIEQELFYPAIAELAHPELLRALDEELLAIRRALAEVLWLGSADERAPSALAALRTLVGSHTSWQERELFTAAAETMTGDELVALREEIRAWSARTDGVPARAAATAA